MDATDIYIIQILLSNSRTSYRLIAEQLNLSVNAVHKRIQSLIEQGIIRSFIARPSFSVTGAVVVLIHGQSNKNPEDLKSKLTKNDSIYWLCAASGDYLYVGIYLKTLNELNSILTFIQEITGIVEPNISILANIPKNSDDPLDDLDHQIIFSLSKDSRKPIADIAIELGSSVKTIRRRLDSMINNSEIELTIDWYPDAANDILSTSHVKIIQGSKFDKNLLLKQYGSSIIMVFQPINSTTELFCITWSPTMKDMKNIIDKIRADPEVESVTPNILYTGWTFPTWRDRISEQLKGN